MGNETPGVVIVNTFCGSDSNYFAGYIGYMDREEAVRREHVEDFDIFSGYMDYMGNEIKTEIFEHPEEISALFSRNADFMDAEGVAKMKDTFRMAQKNGSLMWQTVISFDNEWLAEQELFNTESGKLDERMIKTATRSAVEKLLEKEDLQHAVWTAAIHYNTDNIHVHISAVEPVPMREQKLFKQYEIEQKDKKWQYKKIKNEQTGKMERVPILDKDGNIVEKMEYIGKFKEKSLQAAKSMVVSELISDKDLNLQINQLVRERMLQIMKEHSLYQDDEFRDAFLSLYRKLPENKGVCNYGNTAMAGLREEIDALSMRYIEKHHQEDFEELQHKLQVQEQRYQRAYGGSDNTFAENKNKELLYRMGNTILRELKEYDKNVKAALEKGENAAARTTEPGDNKANLPPVSETANDEIKSPSEDVPVHTLNHDWIASGNKDKSDEATKDSTDFYISWKDGYNVAKRAIYKEKDYDKGIRLLENLAEKGNVLALYELGNIYQYGRGIEEDPETAFLYFQKSLEGFGSIRGKYESYCAYRMGKQYLYGQGTDIDEYKAAAYLQIAADDENQYAMYLLGTLYLQGKGVETDPNAAVNYFEMAAELGNSYAQYQLGRLYEQGDIVQKDAEKSQEYYREALQGFLSIEDKDDHMLHRIGMMYLKGKGVSADFAKAEKYLKDAAELGNENAMLQLGLSYTKQAKDTTKYNQGLQYLHMAAEKENSFAQYALGNLHAKAGDYAGARTWYFKSAANGNQYAAEALFRQGEKGENGVLSRFRGEWSKSQSDLAKSLKWLKRSLQRDVSHRLNMQQHYNLQLQEELKGTDFEIE